MARVTVYHLTLPKRLPLIEEEGLRTRAELAAVLGGSDAFDAAAPGTYAHGKRVSGWLSLDHAREQVGVFGGGLVSYSVDPSRTLANPSSARLDDPVRCWAEARSLKDWLAESVPADLEVHQNLPVRAKRVRLHAPLVTDEQLGAYAPLVAAVADTDRLSAKALMHLAILASDGDFDSAAFTAACALAWRDEEDDPHIVRELVDMDPDKVASAALAEHGSQAPEVAAELRAALEATREWAEQQGMEPGQGLFARTAVILDELPANVA